MRAIDRPIWPWLGDTIKHGLHTFSFGGLSIDRGQNSLNHIGLYGEYSFLSHGGHGALFDKHSDNGFKRHYGFTVGFARYKELHTGYNHAPSVPTGNIERNIYVRAVFLQQLGLYHIKAGLGPSWNDGVLKPSAEIGLNLLRNIDFGNNNQLILGLEFGLDFKDFSSQPALVAGINIGFWKRKSSKGF